MSTAQAATLLLMFTAPIKLASTSVQLTLPTWANTYIKSQHMTHTHPHLSAHLKFPSPAQSQIFNTYALSTPHTHTHTHTQMHAHTQTHSFYGPILPLGSYPQTAWFFFRFRVRKNLVPPSPSPLPMAADGKTACACQRQHAPCFHTTPSINKCDITSSSPLGLRIS